MTAIRHLLVDADGVLQDIPGGWYAAMEPYLGDRAREFLHRTWKDERPTLAGDGDYLPMLARSLREHGVETPVEEVFAAVWHRIEVLEETFAVLEELRRAGYGVHLGTNQEKHRAAYMRTELRYDARFDVSCYSYELGAAKPDAEFFHAAARRIGAEPASILFLDDTARNVESARAAGLAAERWEHRQGIPLLQELLAAHGVSS